MASRELQVIITGDVRRIRAALGDLGSDLDRSGRQADENSSRWSRWGGVVQTGASLGAAAVLAFGAAAATAGAQFEQQMSAVEAVSNATGDEMDALRGKALQLGSDTVYSATESGLAMEELVKAGLSVEDVLNGAADATVNLAAAGGVELPEAATIAANALNAFKLEAEDMPRIADVIAGAANTSAIDVSEFGQSMQQASAVANLVGLSFEDTATAIGLLGDAGIRGSDAGTSLKTMLTRLTPQTLQQSAAMRELGLLTEEGTSKFYDQEGSLKSLDEVAELLRTTLGGLTDEELQQALYDIFGSDALRAGAIMFGEGADGVREFASAMGDIEAADVAETRLDNLLGSVERLKGSVESFLIESSGGLNAGLRELVDLGTEAVDWMADPPQGLIDWATDAGTAIRSSVLPVWEDLVDVGGNVGEMAVGLYDDLDGLGGVLGRLGGGAAVSGLQGTAQGLSTATGFLADHNDLLILVAGSWAAVRAQAMGAAAWQGVAGGVGTATGALQTMNRWLTLIAWNQHTTRAQVFGQMAAQSIRNAASAAAASPAVWAVAAAGTVYALWRITLASENAENRADSLFDRLEDGADMTSVRSLRDLVGEVEAEMARATDKVAEYDGAWGKLRDVGEGITPVANGLTDANAVLEEGEDRVQSYERAITRLDEAAAAGGLSMGELADALSEADIDPATASWEEWRNFLADLEESGSTARNATTGAQTYADALAVIGDEAATTEEEVGALKDMLDAVFSPQLDVWDATTQYKAAMVELTAAIDENGDTLDENTEAGRANRDAVSSAIRQAMELANAIGVQTGNADDGTTAMAWYAAEIRQLADDAGMSDGQVRALGEQLGLLPEDIEILLGLNDEATPGLEDAASTFDEVRSRFSEPFDVAGVTGESIYGIHEDVTSLAGAAALARMATDQLASELSDLDAAPATVTLNGDEFYPTAEQIRQWVEWYGASSPQAEALLNTGGAQLGFSSLSAWAGFYEQLDPATQANLHTNPALVNFSLLFSQAEQWRQTNATATASVNISAGMAAIAQLRGAIDSLDSAASRAAAARSIGQAAAANGNRWGGIYEFAGGGLTEAMALGPGDTLYQWREPETGGEAFIPKYGDRARSLGVLERVGEWLDVGIIDKKRAGLAAMARGGYTGPAPRPSGATRPASVPAGYVIPLDVTVELDGVAVGRSRSVYRGLADQSKADKKGRG